MSRHALAKAARACIPGAMLLALGIHLTAQGPVLTEIMARNASTHREPRTGALHDWIEIHNPGPTTVSLTGWYLTDDPQDLRKWRFPSRAIPAGGFELVYASARNLRISGQPLHTNFELDGDGAFLALVRGDGVTIASAFTPGYPQQHPDLSFGRATGTGALGYFERPTPGTANGATTFAATARRVTASVPRGRYTDPFTVTLQSPTPAATIRYTTDGSRPDRVTGKVYAGPIAIRGTTVLRAVAFAADRATSRVTTLSYLFYADAIAQGPIQPGYPTRWGTHQAPWGPVVRLSDYGMDRTITQSAAYGPKMLDSLESLPVVSIVMAIDDLFDQSTGIYSNPEGEGEAWERPASVEFLAPRMGRGQQVDAGIRITGRGSRRGWANLKHSFRLLFKENYGPKTLDAQLYGPGSAREHNTVVLRGVFNDSFTGTQPGRRETAIYVRDMFVRDTHAAAGQVPAHGSFCHLYINGLYWGLYNPSERPDAAFQATYHGGRRADWDVLKHFNGVVVDGDRQAYATAMQLAAGGLGSAAAYANIRRYVDVEDLADYMVINLFCATDDWPANNWYMARRRQPGAGFKFYSWDAEASLWRVTSNTTGVNQQNSPAFLYDKLRANPEFRLRFADRAHRMLFHDGPLTTARCIERFARRAQEVRAAIISESARWGDAVKRPPYTQLDDWDPDVAFEVQQFFPRRPAIFLDQLRTAGLYPTVAAPTLQPHGGVFLGTQRLTMQAGAGRIYYTTDGSDPRLPGGATAPTARVYAAPIQLQTDTTVRARVLDRGTWSAIVAARFRQPGLTVNEILASNQTGIRDPAGEREDWIEIHNPTMRSIQASGLYLTDDVRAPRKWRIPGSHTLAPGESLIVFADDDTAQPGLHANFKLSADGEGVFLVDRDGRTALSGFHFGAQVADVSTGWLTDGGTRGLLVTFPDPTPGRSNEIPCGRRRFSGRAPDVHPLRMDANGTGRLGSNVTFAIDAATPRTTTLLFLARSPGYLDPLAPANEVAYLLGPYFGVLPQTADAAGRWRLTLGIENSAHLIGLRLYLQAFETGRAGIRGSNAVEFTICR